MDQNLLRSIYQELNERICVYEKAILTGTCACSQAQRLCIAEREGVQCYSDTAQLQCQEFLNLLQQQARFALKHTSNKNALSHVKMLKLQIGGLRGLQTIINLHQPITDKIDDVYNLIAAIKQQFGALENLPFSILIQHITAIQNRLR